MDEIKDCRRMTSAILSASDPPARKDSLPSPTDSVGQRMKKPVLLFLFICLGAFGNPIVVMEHGTYYADKKTSESCIAVLGEESSTISCEVQYRLRTSTSGPDSYYVFVALPVFISSREPATKSGLSTIFAPRIEYDGRTFEPDADDRPSRIRDRKKLVEYKAPEGVEVVIFRFTIDVGLRKRDVRFLVRYTQPTIAGQFLYIPLFEDGEAARSKGLYRFEALAVDSSIQLTATGKDWDMVFPSRIALDLQHQGLIAVGIRRANQPVQTIPGAITPAAGAATAPAPSMSDQ